MSNVKLIEKINRQCEALQKKINDLSGNYLTNTYKRQNEQRNRDSKKDQFRQQLEMLSYFKDEAARRELSLFETALITSTFYEEIKRLASYQRYLIKKQTNSAELVQFGDVAEQYRKTLIKIGVDNTDKLHIILMAFDAIVERAVTPLDLEALRLRDLMLKARLYQKGDIQFTPEALAERMISLAGIYSGSKVLEPEAGIANIADKVKEITPDVDCIEIEQNFREILEIKGHKLVACSLFEYEQQPVYDAVLMNPPFSEETKHIKYAFECLKPGGTLVTICTGRFEYMENKKYTPFREWLEQHEHFYEDSDEKFEMTGTSTVILTIKKGISDQAS